MWPAGFFPHLLPTASIDASKKVADTLLTEQLLADSPALSTVLQAWCHPSTCTALAHVPPSHFKRSYQSPSRLRQSPNLSGDSASISSGFLSSSGLPQPFWAGKKLFFRAGSAPDPLRPPCPANPQTGINAGYSALQSKVPKSPWAHWWF